MKTMFKGRFAQFVLAVVSGFFLAGNTTAQVFKPLHTFTNGPDGANPYGVPYGMVLSGGTLYGAATFGGSNGTGTVFAINLDGTGFTDLYDFSATNAITGTNADGELPNGVVLSGGILYGTTTAGGANGNGTIFALSTNGQVFSNLYSFTAINPYTGANNDGANPYAGVIASGNTLYGTAFYGGASGYGTIFSIGTNGSGFVPMHSFSTVDASGNNNDGANPGEALVLSGGTLFGTATYGGQNGNGTVYAINVGGSGFTNVYTFSPVDVNGNQTVTADGAFPNGLVISGSTLYGTANTGGSNGTGTIFALTTNGAVFTSLHSFAAENGAGDNSDGANPFAALALSGGTLYGVAGYGGTNGSGAVFAIGTNGFDFTDLYEFTATNVTTGVNGDGASPQGGLVVANGVVYGTAYSGGSAGYGTIFSISLAVPAPSLTIAYAGGDIVLTWPTNVAGMSDSEFTLQSTTNLGHSAVWSTVSPAPSIIKGLYTVITPASAKSQYYRLVQ